MYNANGVWPTKTAKVAVDEPLRLRAEPHMVSLVAVDA